MALTANQVQQFYIGFYGRPADPVGLGYWQTQDDAAVLASTGFAGSAEFTNQFVGLTESQKVTKVYANLLGREPDAAGLLYWAGELTAGRQTIGSLVVTMISSALGKDVTTIADRVEYATAFTKAIDTPTEINGYSGATATAAARAALAKVVANATGDHTALTAALTTVDQVITSITSGDTTAPVVTAAQTFSYAENQVAGATIATVLATDAKGVTGYEITTGDTAKLFAIDATGKITLTTAGLTSAANDYETTPNTVTLGVVAKDAAGNVSAVTNVVLNETNVDDTAPKLVAATASGTAIKLNFDEALKAAVLSNTAFTVVDANNASITVNSVTVSGTQVSLVLAATPTGAVKVSYTPATTGDVLQDAAGNKVAAIVSQVAVTDVTAPTLSTSTPADDSITFAAASNLTLTFSENVVLGTGNITIVNAADATDTRTIAVTDTTQVSVSGGVVTVNPTADLKVGGAYYINIPATAVLDAAGNAYAGISSSTALNFTVAATTVAGQSFTLTTGVDILPGLTGSAGTKDTAGNDTIIADNTSATKQLTIADQLDAGTGTDTLKVYISTTDAVTNQPTLTGIENVWINGGVVTAYTAATGTTGLTVEAPVMAVGATGAAISSGNATYTLTGQAVTLKDLVSATATSTTVGASTALTFTTTLASTNDTAVNLTVNGVTSKTRTHTDTTPGATLTLSDTQVVELAGTKMATLNLTATGADSAITLTNTAGAALTTLNITGDKAVSVTEALAGVKTVNASAATGAVTLDVSGVTVNTAFAFTGGSGSDTVTVKAGNLATTALTSGAQFNFGGGTADTLVINDTTPVYSAINAMQGLDVVKLATTGGTFDMAQLTPAKVSFGAVATGVVSNMEASDSVTATGAMSTSLTLGGAVSNSNASLNIGTATTTGFTIASLVTTGLTAIALTSNGTNAAANVISAMTNAENSTFTITGSNDLTMSLTAGALVSGSKVEAATFTGKLNVTATDRADIINGGSGNDTINAGKLGDVINVGTGTDTIALKAAAGAGGADSATFAVPATNTIATTGMDIITGMSTGDKIQLLATAYSGNAGAAAGLIANGTTANTLVGLTLVDNGIEIIRGTFSAGTFVGSATGTDSMVVLDTDATLTTTAYEAIVLVGYVAASVTGIGGNAGLITLI